MLSLKKSCAYASRKLIEAIRTMPIQLNEKNVSRRFLWSEANVLLRVTVRASGSLSVAITKAMKSVIGKQSKVKF